MVSMSQQERRHNFRVRTERPVAVYPVDDDGHLGNPCDASTVDLSANGISVRLGDARRLSGHVCIQLRFEQPPLDQIVFGRTVRAPKPGVVGIRFDGLSQPARSQLTSFVFAEAKRLGQGDRPVPGCATPAAAAPRAATAAAAPTPAPAPAPEPSGPPAHPDRLTVEEFATRIGQTVGSTRRLLNKGLVPGARRMDPTAKKSHWIIPTTAPEDYLALFRRQAPIARAS